MYLQSINVNPKTIENAEIIFKTHDTETKFKAPAVVMAINDNNTITSMFLGVNYNGMLAMLKTFIRTCLASANNHVEEKAFLVMLLSIIDEVVEDVCFSEVGHA